MKRTIITIVVIAAALAGIVYLLQKNKAHNEAETQAAAATNPKVSVRTDTASNRMMNLAYISNGTFEPKQMVTVSAEAQGRVVRVLVDEGNAVRAGQTLAVVESDRINVNVSNAEVNMSQAKSDLDRYESAFKSGGVTEQQLEQARSQYETAKNNYRTAEINAKDITIKTSVGGIVNSRKIEPGTYVSPGTAAFEIVNVSTLKLRVNVDEKNVAPLQLGQEVEIAASVYPEDAYTGKITFISPVADRSLNFPVEIEIQNTSDKPLRAGMYGTATFGVNKKADVLIVPRTAFVGSVSDNKVFVAREGKAIETKVVSGRSFGDYIEVLSGLKAGDVVVTTGQINLLNGTEIEIIK
ncbi:MULTISPECIES: efflux RND transporter periplasmic adaptor subunit [Sphingobacterium]|uniref:Efflux RND transporter periplasmic adaptor subunit n=1 Tax=Sphingobacterium populi TaxID=1812824 RepID=A0ABW5U8S0_9SPHI|nr:efflux RND transporter periplasmic adaptor subunit [Sphingobacterium sp. CFCC 11742]